MSKPAPPQVPGYELERELGVGGMATVYLATQTSLDRKVAIKILRSSAKDSTDPERQEKRFLREGRMLARLSHKNVCGIYDIAKVGDLAYIAMEYIEGGTLGDLLRRGMTAAEAISATVQLAAALSAAHDIGIVHRDLKPANVMMRGRVPVLTDFGIARDLTSNRTEITGDSILGTPNYMSPEQISGHPIDGRSDIYSLGAMLFELLTGRQPYQGDSPIAVCMQHLQAPIPQLPSEFSELQPVLEAMMAKDREDRLPDMASVIVALRSALVDSTVLRQALRFDTELPWSEQLRELGFSFDGSGSEHLRAALKPPVTGAITNQSKKRPPPIAPAPVAAAPTPQLPRFGARERWIALAAVVLLALFGAWWGLSEEKLTPEQMANLKTQLAQFDRTANAGNLVIPSDDNAFDILFGMYAISRVHPEVLVRQQRFRTELYQQVDALAAQARFGEARKRLTDAAPAFDEDDLQQHLAALDQQQMDAQRDAEIASRVGAIEAILASDSGVDDPELGARLADLLSVAGADDSRYRALIAGLSGTLDARLKAALQRGALTDALALRDRMAALMPGSAAARQASTAVETLTQRLTAEQTGAEATALLSSTSTLTPAVVDRVIAGVTALEQAQLEAAASTLRGQLLQRANSAADAALAAADPVAARALVGPLLQRFADQPTLRGVETRLLAAEAKLAEQRRAQEEQDRAGRLALDASPWGKVVSVIGADGRDRAPASDRATPLVLTLPEGQYKVIIEGPDGHTRQQVDASVSRGQLKIAQLSFAALDADAYLREAGYR
jgi:serine/threonine-protein kinase PpkA